MCENPVITRSEANASIFDELFTDLMIVWREQGESNQTPL